MSLPKISFLGCGRLGKTLAKLWYKNLVFQIQDILTQTYNSAVDARNFIGSGRPVKSYKDIVSSDWFCIATNDIQISNIVKKIKKFNFIKGKKIIHFSGCLSSYVLNPLKKMNCEIASLHPALSFSQPEFAYYQFPGTYCTVEGDLSLVLRIREIIEKIGGKFLHINAQDKPAYHTACCFSSNFIYSLMQYSISILINIGFSKKKAKNLSVSILSKSLDSLKKTNKILLTGPINRGDINIIKKHIKTLKNTIWSKPYRMLSLEIIHYASIQRKKKKNIINLLKKF